MTHVLLCYLYSQHVECVCTLVSGSIDLQNKVDQGEIVDTDHVLLVPNISLHGDQSEHAQQVQDGGTKFPQFRGMKLCIAHV